MKITTGLFPEVVSQRSGFVVAFTTTRDSRKAPRGTIVSSLFTEIKPTIRHLTHSLHYRMGQDSRHEEFEKRYSIPGDAEVTVGPDEVSEVVYVRRYSWYEVIA